MLFRRKKEVAIRQPNIQTQNESYTFRRSRTLTGSSASSVKTVGESRAQLKSPRILANELRLHRRKLAFYLVVVLIIIASGWLLISQFTGGIRQISLLPANAKADARSYERLIQDYLARHPVERFRFAMNEEQLEDYLSEKAPEVARIQLNPTKQPGMSDMQVRFRQPVVVWEISRQRYYVDANGQAFAKNYYPEPAVTVHDQSGIDPNSGAIASNRFLYFLGRVVTLMNESGIATVSGVVIPPNTTREVDLRLTGKNYIVKTRLDRDPAEQVSDIVNTIKFLDSKGVTPQYIDARVSGRAFYR